jgi:hypothetical protein
MFLPTVLTLSSFLAPSGHVRYIPVEFPDRPDLVEAQREYLRLEAIQRLIKKDRDRKKREQEKKP